MLLSSAFQAGRENNFNAIRMVAAMAVLIAHSWPLALGRHVPDPLAAWTGLGLGGIAVDVFFVTSGFLVTASLMRRGSLLDFAVARSLRIYPALIVAVLACVGLGLAVTALPWQDFLAEPRTTRFLRNALAFRSAEGRLPGVFEANPFPRVVNGSLWTIVWEVRAYATIAIVWALASLARGRQQRTGELAIVGLAAAAGSLHLLSVLTPGTLPKVLTFKHGLIPLFLAGGAFYVLRARIRLKGAWALGAFLVVIAAGALGGAALLQAAHFLALPYLLLWLAFAPAGGLRRDGQEDLSYGVYLFAFPVQQTIVALVPGISVLGLTVSAAAVTLGLAWLSWRFVERPALERKEATAAALRRLLARVHQVRSWIQPPART